MSLTFFRKVKLPLKIKQNLYSLYTFDNQPILINKKKIDKETGSILINIGTHQEMLNLDMIKTFTYNVTFGLPWLKKHDLRISYKKGIIKFKNCECQSKPEI